MAADSVDDDDDHAVEALAHEGGDDATLVMDFESTASELLQSDEELAAAFTAYTDAGSLGADFATRSDIGKLNVPIDVMRRVQPVDQPRILLRLLSKGH